MNKKNKKNKKKNNGNWKNNYYISQLISKKWKK